VAVEAVTIIAGKRNEMPLTQPDEIIDHEEVRGLFQRLRQDSGERKELLLQTIRELKVHAQIEERAYYPAMRKLNGMAEKIDEGVQEHLEVTKLIQDIEGKAIFGQIDEEKLKALIENVEHHAQEEEAEILPRTAEMPEVEAVGQRITQLKQMLSAGLAALAP
jgi:hypothetical protein